MIIPSGAGTTPMFDLGMSEFKHLDTGKITPKEYFTNSYIEEVFESDFFVIPLSNYIQF